MVYLCHSMLPLSFLVKWTSGFLLTLGWSRGEDLVCVQEDGAVLLYDMFGNYQHTFNMGQVRW